MRTRTKIKVVLSIALIIFATIFAGYVYEIADGELTKLFTKAFKLIPIYIVFIFTIILRDQNILRFADKITSGLFADDKKKRKKLIDIIDRYYEKTYYSAIARLDKLEKECDRNDEVSVILTIKGMCLLGLKKDKEVVPVLDRALQLNPANSYAWANQGYTYYQLGYHDLARNLFEKAVATDSHNAFAHSNLAFSCLYNKELDEALEHAYIALEYENKRDDAIAIMALGRAFQGDAAEAKWYCKRYNGPRKSRRLLRKWLRDIEVQHINIEQAHQLSNWSSVVLGTFREPF